MKKQFKKAMRTIYRSIMKSLRSREGRSPEYMARTFAVGFSSGAFVLYGQSAICVALWFAMAKLMKKNFNLVLACLLTLISNPLTTPFIFYAFYLTGQRMLGASAIEFSTFLSSSGLAMLDDLSLATLWHTIKMLAKGVGKPILVGSLPWHAIMAVVGYAMGWRIAIAARRRRIAKRKKSLAIKNRLRARAKGDINPP
ncbi:MAG: DUF2062 domain-containing protein [Rickettsiales bacterium]|nr:DUF2062 domain-containing protein [Rickettsiales bacterium]